MATKKNTGNENELKLFNAKKNYELANENIVRTQDPRTFERLI